MKQIKIKDFTITIDDSEEELTNEQIIEWVNHVLGERANQIKSSNPLVDFSLQEVEVDWREIQIKSC